MQMAITWLVSTKEAAISCTVSSLSNVVVCMMDAKWQTGGEDLTEKGGSTVIHQNITLLAFGEIKILVQTMVFFC